MPSRPSSARPYSWTGVRGTDAVASRFGGKASGSGRGRWLWFARRRGQPMPFTNGVGRTGSGGGFPALETTKYMARPAASTGPVNPLLAPAQTADGLVSRALNKALKADRTPAPGAAARPRRRPPTEPGSGASSSVPGQLEPLEQATWTPATSASNKPLCPQASADPLFEGSFSRRGATHRPTVPERRWRRGIACLGASYVQRSACEDVQPGTAGATSAPST